MPNFDQPMKSRRRLVFPQNRSRAVAIAVLFIVVGGSFARGFAQPASSHGAHGYPDTSHSAPASQLAIWGLVGAAAVALTAFVFFRRRSANDGLNSSNATTIRTYRADSSDRRSFIKYGAAGLLAAGTGHTVWRYKSVSATDTTSTAGVLSDKIDPCFNNSPVGRPFAQPLTIPPALNPIPQVTADTYVISETRSQTEIVPGFVTPIWGYDGIVPGPTILARKGRPVSVTFTND
jgi:hypothetical protein